MKWKIIAILVLSLFVRTFRLDSSSHFEFDESRDLVNIHQIWVEKKITLVGPISEDRGHVYSSLTYYMLLPFAVLFRFDPISTAIGAVFWGMLTAALLIIVTAKHNPKLMIPAAILAAVFVPMVTTSRWAWNPNLLMFWFLLGVLFYDKQKWYWKLASALAFGLMIHHHYLAVVPIGLWVLVKRDWKIVLGLLLAVMPFVIFDLRHPPGVFILRMIEYNQGSLKQNPLFILSQIPVEVNYFFTSVFQVNLIAIAGMAATLALAVWDVVKKTSSRSWLFIWTLSLVPLALYHPSLQYILPTLPFFIIWLIQSRTGWGLNLSKIVTCLIILGSIFTISRLWNQADWEGNLKIDRGGTEIIAEQITKQNLKNPNLAVLGSPDIFTNGYKFRNLLLVRNIRVRAYEEYEFSDNLFVVTKSSPDVLRKDPAVELLNFKNGPVAGVWNIPDTDWKVVQFNRY